MMNRRDLLKYFAAGTVIAPVSGAAPLAKLIEIPKVELFEARIFQTPIVMTDVLRATVQFEMADGTTRTAVVNHYSKDGQLEDGGRIWLEFSVENTASPRAFFGTGAIGGEAKLS